jgi:hypothetical protein
MNKVIGKIETRQASILEGGHHIVTGVKLADGQAGLKAGMALYRDAGGCKPVPAGYAANQKPVAVLLDDIDGETSSAVASAAIHGLIRCEKVMLASGAPATSQLVEDLRGVGIYLSGDPAPSAVVPVIVGDIASASIAEGAALTLSFVVTAHDEGEISYQWYSNTGASASGGTAIADATGPSYAVDTSAAGTKYLYCVATNALNGTTATATSAVATVTITEV